MSENTIATELENLVTYLRDARQLVLDYGGEISATAGLKDTIEALRQLLAGNTPAGDNTLLFKILDRSITSIAAEDLDGLTNIGNSAFYDCDNLTDVKLPNGITSIGNEAFANCGKLLTVVLSESVQTISLNAFRLCTKLESIVIPEGIERIVRDAFDNCPSKLFKTFNSARYLGNNSNNYVALIEAENTAITVCAVNDQTRIIADNAFINCSKLVSVSISNSVKYIGNGAFSGAAKLADVTFGSNSNLLSILGSAFQNCTSLTSIEIPDSVTSIGGGAFYGCTGLTSIKFGANIDSIGNTAFSKCTACQLYDFTSTKTVPKLDGAAVFPSTTTDYKIKVPAALYDEWTTATNWSLYADHIIEV